MTEELEKIAGWFDDYERQHAAKGTVEGDLKARTNAERAAYVRSLSALSQDAKPEPGVTVTDAMVERALQAYEDVFEALSDEERWEPANKIDVEGGAMRAGLTAALQPPVAGE